MAFTKTMDANQTVEQDRKEGFKVVEIRKFDSNNEYRIPFYVERGFLPEFTRYYIVST